MRQNSSKALKINDFKSLFGHSHAAQNAVIGAGSQPLDYAAPVCCHGFKGNAQPVGQLLRHIYVKANEFVF